jgi:hypothetical protein
VILHQISTTMAGTKRHFDEADGTKAKKAKMEVLTHRQKPIKALKSSPGESSSLPTPHKSATLGKGLVDALSTADIPKKPQKDETSKPRKDISRPNDRAKTSIATNGREALANGEYLY